MLPYFLNGVPVVLSFLSTSLILWDMSCQKWQCVLVATSMLGKFQTDTHAIENITTESMRCGSKKKKEGKILMFVFLFRVCLFFFKWANCTNCSIRHDSKTFLILPLISLHLLSLIYDVTSSTQLRTQRCDGGCQTLPVFLLRRLHDIYSLLRNWFYAAQLSVSVFCCLFCVPQNLYWKREFPTSETFLWTALINILYCVFCQTVQNKTLTRISESGNKC